MIGATSCGISDQMRDMCISYAGGAGIMLHIKERPLVTLFLTTTRTLFQMVFSFSMEKQGPIAKKTER
jgi:hypothetical protein